MNGLRRRESAGACLGRLARLQDRAARRGKATAFPERIFHKLLLNFTWWVNRKDAEGRNVFQGGFLGLDNIGVFDRSARRLPTGGAHRAVRRHRLDGHVLPQHAGHRDGAGAEDPPTRTSPASSGSISSTSRTP
jgi:hypothetical protein